VTPAEYQKKFRNTRKSNGLCVICGLVSRFGKNTCEICQKKRNHSIVTWRHNNKDIFNIGCKTRYRNHRKAGLCTRCSNKTEKTLCQSCATILNIYRKKCHDTHILNSKCINCGSNVSIGTLCDVCKLKRSIKHSTPEHQIQNRFYRKNNWKNSLFSTLKARAKKKSIFLDMNLCIDNIPDPNGKKCPVFGTDFIMGSGKKSPYSATIDRINPSLGYTKDNIQLISSLANDIKSGADASLIERVGIAVLNAETNKTIINDFDESTKSHRQKIIHHRKSCNTIKRHLEFSIDWYNISLP